jgi:predicted permease
MSRQRDIAVRSALGASWGRIVRLLLTESLLVAVIGGIAGVLVAYAALPLLVASLPKDQQAVMPFLQDLHIGQSVLWFSAAVSIFAGIAFGLLPALQVAGTSVRDGLQDNNRITGDSLRHRLRNGLVVSQIAVAIVLLVSAGLLMKSLTKLLHVDPGFNVAHLLTFETSVPAGRHHAAGPVVALERDMRERLQAVPGVKAVATVNALPIRDIGGTSRFVIAGRARTPDEEHEANGRDVSANYFLTMGIPLHAGRLLNDHDDAQSPHVVVINQALADELFPHQNPIGKRIDFTYTRDANVWEIVGVVGNENVGQLDRKPTPVFYDTFAQSPNGGMSVVLRTTGDPSAVADGMTTVMHQLDSRMPVSSLATMDRIIAESPSVAMRRYPAYLIGAFAFLALALAVIGVYGLLAYVVAQRTRELGIRLALGAQRGNLLRMVVSNGLKLALIGVAIGAAGSVAAGRMLSTLLFAVRPTDIPVLLSVTALLVLVSLLASYVPARRAASIEPMKALRTE